MFNSNFDRKWSLEESFTAFCSEKVSFSLGFLKKLAYVDVPSSWSSGHLPPKQEDKYASKPQPLVLTRTYPQGDRLSRNPPFWVFYSFTQLLFELPAVFNPQPGEPRGQFIKQLFDDI